jgi:hypothetical protein
MPTLKRLPPILKLQSPKQEHLKKSLSTHWPYAHTHDTTLAANKRAIELQLSFEPLAVDYLTMLIFVLDVRQKA